MAQTPEQSRDPNVYPQNMSRSLGWKEYIVDLEANRIPSFEIPRTRYDLDSVIAGLLEMEYADISKKHGEVDEDRMQFMKSDFYRGLLMRKVTPNYFTYSAS